MQNEKHRLCGAFLFELFKGNLFGKKDKVSIKFNSPLIKFKAASSFLNKDKVFSFLSKRSHSALGEITIEYVFIII